MKLDAVAPAARAVAAVVSSRPLVLAAAATTPRAAANMVTTKEYYEYRQTREHFCLASQGPNHLTDSSAQTCVHARHWLRRLGMTRSGQAGILAVGPRS